MKMAHVADSLEDGEVKSVKTKRKLIQIVFQIFLRYFSLVSSVNPTFNPLIT